MTGKLIYPGPPPGRAAALRFARTVRRGAAQLPRGDETCGLYIGCAAALDEKQGVQATRLYRDYMWLGVDRLRAHCIWFCLALLGCGGGSGMDEAAAPTTLRIDSGNGQIAHQTARLAVPVGVVVLDQNGRPVPGIEVSFEAQDGGMSVPASVRTDADGKAASVWTLGRPIGNQSLRASTGALSEVFFATATQAPPTPPYSLEKTGGDDQRALQYRAVASSLTVSVTDALGNDVPDVPVDFTVREDGRSQRVLTNLQGSAQWRPLFSVAGEFNVDAKLGSDAVVSFRVTVTPVGGPFDGEYVLYYRFFPAQEFVSGLKLRIERGQVISLVDLGGNADNYGSHSLVSALLTESDGALHLTVAVPLNRQYRYDGTLVLDAFGNASGSGTLQELDPFSAGLVTRRGIWDAARP